MIIKLYSKGVTTREIADLIEKMYGSHYSPAQVSNISKHIYQQANKAAVVDVLRAFYAKWNKSYNHVIRNLKDI